MIWKRDPETGKYISGRFAIRKGVAQYWGERKMGTRVNWVIEIDGSDKHDHGSGEFTLTAAKARCEKIEEAMRRKESQERSHESWLAGRWSG